MSELPNIMASLELVDNPQITSDEPKEENTKTEKNETAVPVSRTLRKRLNTSYLPQESSKRRCSLRPTKLSITENADDGKTYFLGKKFNPLNFKKLATIYEEPKVKKNGTVTHIGTSKLRKLNFNSTKEKVKKRKAKSKGLNRKRQRKLSMDAFLSRLSGLMNTTSASGGGTNIVTSLMKCEME